MDNVKSHWKHSVESGHAGLSYFWKSDCCNSSSLALNASLNFIKFIPDWSGVCASPSCDLPVSDKQKTEKRSAVWGSNAHDQYGNSNHSFIPSSTNISGVRYTEKNEKTFVSCLSINLCTTFRKEYRFLIYILYKAKKTGLQFYF